MAAAGERLPPAAEAATSEGSFGAAGAAESFPLSILPTMTYAEMTSSPLLYVACIASFFLTHALLVCLLRLCRAKSPLLAECAFPRHGVNRIISTLHACIVINWSLLVLLEDSRSAEPAGAAGAAGSRCLFHFGRPVTVFERPLLLFSFSYFLYDTFYELASWDISSVLHHVTCIVDILVVLANDRAGTDLVTALLIAEISTPALHLRYGLVQYSKKADALAKSLAEKEEGGANTSQGERQAEAQGAVEAASHSGAATWAPEVVAEALKTYDFKRPLDAVERAFFIIFLFGRGVAAPCLVYACVTCRTTPNLVRIGSVGILVVSVFWIVLLFRGLIKRIKNRPRGSLAGQKVPTKCKKREFGVLPVEAARAEGDSPRGGDADNKKVE
ncbi:hypothetical protein BESB_026430 [Besnoitia besnoiti]|uniref:TLC domain-containing protein n=1 Tax=Besnoitia besnoiti TaxID=94643 RepID=A0A2A9M129_BESBE|nr:uncharacterized protein BESB_026430 [Besnoitia besnoiti]PFH31669.1 hypothetical protein BESB_026430 [Besnoitia besnoiti]